MATQMSDVLGLHGHTLRKDPEEDFTLLEVLGEGSYGAVWKAMHMNTGRIVALKRVEADSPEDVLKEISMMRNCDSPHIVRLYGSYLYEGFLWIVMEYCGGGSIGDLITILKSPLTETQMATIAKHVLQGLHYLHEKRMIHRDIKAANILLTTEGDVKLADFGVSGTLTNTMAKRNTVIGTRICMMAPEIIQERGYNTKADIWSFGITAIEMAEKNPPYFDIHPMRAIFIIPSKPPPTLKHPNRWSKEFNEFIAQCLTKSADHRPSAGELLKHPFLKKASSSVVLQPLIGSSMDAINNAGSRSAAMGTSVDTSSIRVSIKKAGTIGRLREANPTRPLPQFDPVTGTTHWPKSGMHHDSPSVTMVVKSFEGDNNGTTVINNIPSGTMIYKVSDDRSTQ